MLRTANVPPLLVVMRGDPAEPTDELLNRFFLSTEGHLMAAKKVSQLDSSLSPHKRALSFNLFNSSVRCQTKEASGPQRERVSPCVQHALGVNDRGAGQRR